MCLLIKVLQILIGFLMNIKGWINFDKEKLFRNFLSTNFTTSLTFQIQESSKLMYNVPLRY